MISDRPLIGLLFVFVFCLLAPLGDALVKVVGIGAPLMMLPTGRGDDPQVCITIAMATPCPSRHH